MSKKKQSRTRAEIARRNDWEKQSERDLEVSRLCFSNDFYEWSCYCAQQSAEKALKALLCKLGIVKEHIHGHDLVHVARSIPEYLINDNQTLESHCAYLSDHTEKTRYPDLTNSGYPGHIIKKNTAEKAIEAAEYVRNECNEISQYLDKTPAR